MKNKHLLKLMDLDKSEITEILDLADMLKTKQKAGVEHHYLKGQTLGMIFAKSSTRTRVSFEVGMYQLGGHALCLNASDLQIGRGEPIEDTARVMGRYLNGIMIRTYEHAEVEKLAEYAGIPIINGLTDLAHPCQVLADLMTIREYKNTLKGLTMCYIGDGNNMANSLIAGGIITGMKVRAACPEGYWPDKSVLDFAGKGDFTLTGDIFAAAKDADVVVTDVWASMGMEKETARRREDFKGYCVDAKLMAVAKKDAIVQHCLPAHKGEEISAEVFETHAREIFDEAENRLHAQKAVMVLLMGKDDEMDEYGMPLFR